MRWFAELEVPVFRMSYSLVFVVAVASFNVLETLRLILGNTKFRRMCSAVRATLG